VVGAAVEFHGQHLVLVSQVKPEPLAADAEDELAARVPQAPHVEHVKIAP
jgi:hypothetical protein